MRLDGLVTEVPGNCSPTEEHGLWRRGTTRESQQGFGSTRLGLTDPPNPP